MSPGGGAASLPPCAGRPSAPARGDEREAHEDGNRSAGPDSGKLVTNGELEQVAVEELDQERDRVEP